MNDQTEWAGGAGEPFVRAARRMFRHWLWTERRVYSRFEAWFDLVQQASFEPTKRVVAGAVIEIPRGGLVASERFLSDRWMWSRTKVRAFLDLLESEDMIHVEKPRIDTEKNQQKNHRITVVCLRNFEKYNRKKDHPENHGKDRKPDHRKTTEEPPEDQREEGKEGSVESLAREIPQWGRVQAYAGTIGLAEWKARDWFDEMEGVGWIDHLSRPIRNWQAILRRVKTKWEADGRPVPGGGKGGRPAAQSKFAFGKPEYDDKGRMVRDALGKPVSPS